MTDATNEDTGSRGGFGTILRLQIELWLVVLFMALAFGAGILISALYEEPTTAVVGGNTSQITAPPLTDQQIEGGLPSGHPDIGGTTGAAGETGSTGGKDTGSAGGNGN